MNGEHRRPLPRLYDWNRPFYASGVNGSFVLQQCNACKALLYYPRIACTTCLSTDYGWLEHPGTGSVYSYAVVWRPQHPAFNDQVPITIAAIELTDGPTIVSNIVGSSVTAVAIGAPVRVRFEVISAEMALPVFELAS